MAQSTQEKHMVEARCMSSGNGDTVDGNFSSGVNHMGSQVSSVPSPVSPSISFKTKSKHSDNLNNSSENTKRRKNKKSQKNATGEVEPAPLQQEAFDKVDHAVLQRNSSAFDEVDHAPLQTARTSIQQEPCLSTKSSHNDKYSTIQTKSSHKARNSTIQTKSSHNERTDSHKTQSNNIDPESISDTQPTTLKHHTSTCGASISCPEFQYNETLLPKEDLYHPLKSKHTAEDQAKVSVVLNKSHISTRQIPKQSSWKTWQTTAKEKRKYLVKN